MNKNEIDFVMKAMKKAIKKVKAKNAIEDLFDGDRMAEMDPDSIPSPKTSALNKKDDKDCECKSEDEKECECEEAAPMDKGDLHDLVSGRMIEDSDGKRGTSAITGKPHQTAEESGRDKKDYKRAVRDVTERRKKRQAKFTKNEQFIEEMVKNFQVISEAYLAKATQKYTDEEKKPVSGGRLKAMLTLLRRNKASKMSSEKRPQNLPDTPDQDRTQKVMDNTRQQSSAFKERQKQLVDTDLDVNHPSRIKTKGPGPGLQQQIAQHQLSGKKTGIPRIDRDTADFRRESRSATGEEIAEVNQKAKK
jgi:hypothetical protein